MNEHTTTSEQAVVAAFPRPGRLVRHAFGQLRVARLGTREEKHVQIGDMNYADLPQPWDPPTCTPELRKHVWAWLDQVAAWINHEYLWHYDRFIPSCWPAHPHIAHELAAVAALRYEAGFALSAETIEEWHRQTLPGFLDRTAGLLGSSPCGPGKHNDWPAATRFKDFQSPAALQRRQQAFAIDKNYTAPPRTGPKARRQVRPTHRDQGGSPQDTADSSGTTPEDGHDA